MHPGEVLLSIPVHAARPAAPLHPSIDGERIGRLVDRFYGRVRADERLGPIFEARLAGRWPDHLERMTLFWRSVLLREGVFKGQPVPKHKALGEVVSEDYRLWLGLFRDTAAEVFERDAAAVVVAAAERVAASLWIASFAGPFDSPPAWIHGDRLP